MRYGVRALAGALLVVGLMPVVAPSRPAYAGGGNAANAIFECAYHTSSGWVTVWGYENGTDHTKNDQVGASNHFIPTDDVGQPETFDTGTHHNVLIVPWDGTSTLGWHLEKSEAYASTGNTCASNPVPITGTGLSALVGIGMLAVMGFGLDRFLRWRRARSAKS